MEATGAGVMWEEGRGHCCMQRKLCEGKCNRLHAMWIVRRMQRVVRYALHVLVGWGVGHTVGDSDSHDPVVICRATHADRGTVYLQ